jgi:hypothetical protein
MANKTDEQVQSLVELVKKKKLEITKAEKPNWKTNCNFRYNPGSPVSINIQVENDVDTLIGILSFLMVQDDAFKKAADDLGVDGIFKWGGYTFEEWKNDISNRVVKIQIAKKKADLDILETRLDKLISPELKTQLELEEITKLLGK